MVKEERPGVQITQIFVLDWHLILVHRSDCGNFLFCLFIYLLVDQINQGIIGGFLGKGSLEIIQYSLQTLICNSEI